MNYFYKLFKISLSMFFVLLMFASLSYSQVANYQFTQSVGTYTTITGGTIQGTSTNDDNNFNAINIGFTFNFNGVNYTQVSVNANGFLAMGPTVVSSYTAISSGTSNNVIVPLNRDLQGGTGSELMTKTEGTSPNQVFIVQWKTYKRYGTTGTGDDYNFQIRLNESSNKIDLVYGTMTNNATATTVQVGIRGASSADFSNRTTTTDWASSTAGGTNTATMALSSTIFPVSGLTFTYSPPNFPPSITYTALLNTSSTSNRNLNGVIITDQDGVNGTSGTAPRIYFKKSTDANVFIGNTSTDNGWKWTESTGSSPFNFTIDYSIINGGSVSIADTVQYFVVAQDLAGTPLVGSNPSTGFVGTSVSAITSAPTTPNKYIITAASLSGDYTVGTAMFNMIAGKNIYFEKVVNKIIKEVDVLVPVPENRIEKGKGTNNASNQPPTTLKQLMEVEETTWIPMENGMPYAGDLYIKKAEHPEIDFPNGIEGVYSTITSAVADLNLRGVLAPVRFLLTDTLYSTGETYPITIAVSNENNPTSTNTVTFKPNTGITSKILCGTAQNVFSLTGCDYITFDGSNSTGGTTRDLSIVNTYAGSSFNIVIALFHNGIKGATNNTIKNCIVEGTPTTTSSYGLFLNAAGGGFNNTSFINNKIQNAKVGIQFAGVSGGVTNTGLISGNIIGDVVKPLKSGGILCAYADNTIITGNDIFGETLGNINTSQYGILLSTGSTNSKVQKNKIHDFYYTGSSGYGCFGIRFSSDATTVTEISNNFIYDIKADGDSTSLGFIPSGIYISTGGNVNIYYNSIYLSGNTLGQGATYKGRSTCISIPAAITLLDIRNNIFQNSMGSYPGSTMSNATYGILCQSANTAFTNINYNDYFVNGVSPFVGYLGANQLDLTAWQTATGQDLNSISAIAAFTDSTNLHIPNGTVTALESAGTPIAGVSTDIDNQTRNASTPDIGADEFAGVNPADVLAGDYYIPQGSNPQGFATLADAMAALNSFGVSSAVRFLIDDNLNEVGANLLITRSDLTETNNLIIKPVPTKTPTITITGCATASGATQYSGIAYSGASYITIDGSNTVGGTTRDLTVAMNDSVNGRIGITLFGNTDFIAIKNTNIIFQKITILNSSTRGIYANGQATGVADSLIVENCKIGDDLYAPAYSVSITGSSGSSFYASKVYIKNNELRGVLRSVYFFYGGAPGTISEISGNTINPTYAPVIGNVVWGMLFNTYGGTVNIFDNKMYHLISNSNATNGVYGIGTLTSQPGTVVNIFNNFLGGDFQHTGTGIPASVDVISFQDNIPEANVYFNTIVLNNINKPTAPRLTGIRWGGTANVNLLNNIVINENDAPTAYALYSAGGTFTSNYNDLYVSGATANIGFSGVARQSFQTWQDSTGQDANSVNITAPFTAALDFHIPDGTLTQLESAGTPVAGITTDIDGQTRNASTPDIGADEFAGLLQINAPSNLTAVADTFAVVLNWIDNSTNELGFYVERKDGDSLSVNPFAVIDTVVANVVTYNDLGRTPNTTYTYRVQAYNLLGVSPYSNVVTATTIVPVELSSFSANVGEKEISVMWSTATELNNRGFELERKLDGEWQKVTFIEGKGTTTEKSNYTYSDKFKYDGFQGTLQYRLKQIDFDGTITYSKAISVEVDFTPKEYTLYQNYPNPFNPSTTIKFALPFDSNVRITIYNLLGEQVAIIFDQVKEVGYHNVNWNASGYASGVYIYSIEAKSLDGLKNFSSVKKMMLMK